MKEVQQTSAVNHGQTGEPDSSSHVPASTPPRWTGPEIVAVLFLALLSQLLVHALLDGSGWFRWYYSEELPDGSQAGDAAQLALMRRGLWVGSLASILQVVLTLTWFRLTIGVRPAEFGLTTNRAGRNVLLGLLFAVIFAPGAYGIQALALLAMRQLGVEEQAHPFTIMGQGSLYPTEWMVLIVSAVVLAPVWEELLYRGVIQPWVMSRQPWGGPAALTAALIVTLSVRWEMLRAASGQALLVELIPLVVLVAMAPLYLVLWRRSPERAALFAAAVLFAWVHARVWPSPVALVWLALGLGWLRWKTGSLVGSIVLHAVFNGIACGMLLRTLWWRS